LRLSAAPPSVEHEREQVTADDNPSPGFVQAMAMNASGKIASHVFHWPRPEKVAMAADVSQLAAG
jgi:hypothetical protein